MVEESASDRSINIGQGVSNSIVISGDGNQIIQISAAEVKTRQFILTSPYKGLKKFEQTDKDRFFGREQFVRQLINDLNQTNLLLLLGASGSGKSSVVRAGLIPQLAQRWGDRFVNLTFNPDNDPFESLYASLLNRYGQTKTQFVRQGRAGTLVQLVETLKSTDDYWLIFVDQFEELFTTSQVEKCNQFISDLVQLNQRLKQFPVENCQVKIIAAMRSDFLDRLSPYPNLVKATDLSRPIIAELQLDELRLAIEQPAAHYGVVFEEGLVEEIIKDVQGQAGYLPLLQYTLDLLWETEVKTDDINNTRTLPIHTYRALGGVRGALQKRVEQIYEGLSEANSKAKQLPSAKQLAAQRIFLKLVEIAGNAEAETEWKPLRRRALQSEFSDEQEQAVLKQLIDQNLLVSNAIMQTDGPAPVATVEVAHEILLTSWSRLNEWIQEYHRKIALRNRLNDDVVRWQPKKNEDELWSGSKLEQAVELKKDPTFNQVLGGFSTTANEFIEASVGRRDRQRRRTIFTLAGGLILALSLSSIAGLGWYRTMQQNKAEVKRRIALESTSLATQPFDDSKDQIENFLRIMKSAQLLKSIVEENQSPKDYPVLEPFRALIALTFNTQQNQFVGHQGRVNSVSFSPDNKYIASAGEDGYIKIWDLSGREVRKWESHQRKPVNRVVFSPNGQFIATLSDRETIAIYNRQGKTLSKWKYVAKWINFSIDSQTILATGIYNEVGIWNLYGKPKTTLKHQDNVLCASLSPDGQLIASLDINGKIHLWNASNYKHLASWDSGISAALSIIISGDFIQFSPESKRLVLTNYESDKIKVFNLEGQTIAELNSKNKGFSVNSLHFTTSGDGIVAAGSDGKLHFWRLVKDDRSERTWGRHQGAILSMSYSSDEKYIATGGEDGTVRLWNSGINSSTLVTNLKSHFGSVNGLRFISEKDVIVTVGDDSTVRVWSRLGQLIKSWNSYHGRTGDLDYNSKSQLLLTAGTDGSIRTWNLSGKLINSWQAHSKVDESTQVFGIGIALGSDAKTKNIVIKNVIENSPAMNAGIKVGDHILAINQKPVQGMNPEEISKLIRGAKNTKITLKISRQPNEELNFSITRSSPILFPASVTSASFSTQGDKIVTTGLGDNIIRIWDVSGQLISQWQAPSTPNKAQFSPVNEHIAVVDVAGFVYIINLKGERISQWKAHPSLISVLSFTSDGKQLVTVESDTISIWDVSGKKINTPQSFTGAPITSARFSPDNQYLAVSQDTFLTIQSTSGQVISVLGSGSDSIITDVDFSSDGRSIALASLDGITRVLPVDNLDTALARGCSRLFDYLSNHSQDPQALEVQKICQDKNLLVDIARNLARDGKVESSIAKFKEALNLNPLLKIEPEKEAKRLAAFSILEEGKSLARTGDLKGAIDQFKKAVDFSSDLNLNPEYEARRLAEVGRLVTEMQKSVKKSDYKKAVRLLGIIVQLDPTISMDDLRAGKMSLTFEEFGKLLAAAGLK